MWNIEIKWLQEQMQIFMKLLQWTNQEFNTNIEKIKNMEVYDNVIKPIK
jgi:hypothetical protein